MFYIVLCDVIMLRNNNNNRESIREVFVNKKLFSMLLGATALVPTVSMAIGLGSIRTKSSLNEKLNATIPILSLKDKGRLNVSLAPHSVFAKRGIRRSEELNILNFSTYKKGDRTYVRVSSGKPINSPYLNFIVQLSSAEGTVSREYAIFLDPPSAKEKAKKTVTKRSLVTNQKTQKRTASVQKEKPLQNIKKTTNKKQSPNVQVSGKSGRYGPVRSGETLWSIASHTRPSADVSVHDMLAAIKTANPRLSKGLQSGMNLVIPTLSGYKSYSGGYAPMPGEKATTSKVSNKKPKRTQKSKPKKNSLESQLRESVAKKPTEKKKSAKAVRKKENPKNSPKKNVKVAKQSEKQMVADSAVSEKIVKTITRKPKQVEDNLQSKEKTTVAAADSMATTAAIQSTTSKGKEVSKPVDKSRINLSDGKNKSVKIMDIKVADATPSDDGKNGTQKEESLLVASEKTLTGELSEVKNEESKPKSLIVTKDIVNEPSTDEVPTNEQAPVVIKSIPMKKTPNVDGEPISNPVSNDEEKVALTEKASTGTTMMEDSVANAEENIVNKMNDFVQKTTDAISNNLTATGGAVAVFLGLSALLLLRKRRKTAEETNTSDVVLLNENDIDIEPSINDIEPSISESNAEESAKEGGEKAISVGNKAEVVVQESKSARSVSDVVSQPLADVEGDLAKDVSIKTFSPNDNELAPNDNELAADEEDMDFDVKDYEDSDFITEIEEPEKTEKVSESKDTGDKRQISNWNYSFGGLANKKQSATDDSSDTVDADEKAEKVVKAGAVQDDLDEIDFDSALLGLDDTISENKGEKPTTTYMSDLASSVSKEDEETIDAVGDNGINFNLDETNIIDSSLSEAVEHSTVDDGLESLDVELSIEDSVTTASFSGSYTDIDIAKVDMKLDLAKSFLSIGDESRAIDLLKEVVEKGNERQIQEAKALLAEKED